MHRVFYEFYYILVLSIDFCDAGFNTQKEGLKSNSREKKQEKVMQI